MAGLRNECSIYMKFGRRKIKIPVNPEELKIQYPSDNKTYHVIGKGEVVVPRKPSLRVVSWESFFPGDNGDPYVNSGAKDPEDYEKYFSDAMKNKTIGRLIISRSGMYDTNLPCIVSNFETTDKGGEPGDMYYSIELTEYRSYAPETVSVLAAPAESSEPAEASTEAVREVETPVLRVGASVIANGKYWYDSYGSKPYGTANNLNTTITRIVSGNPYPIHIGSYGWISESQIQITG